MSGGLLGGSGGLEKVVKVYAGRNRCHMDFVEDSARIKLTVTVWTHLVVRPVQASASSL